MSTNKKNGEDFEKIQQSHREEAVDEIIAYEAEQRKKAEEEKHKKETFEHIQKSAKKTFSSSKKGNNKKPYNVVLSVQFLIVLLYLVVSFIGFIWSAPGMPDPYYIGQFITNVAVFLGFSLCVYYYVDGFKRNDKIFIVALIAAALTSCVQIYTNMLSTISLKVPWFFVLLIISALMYVLVAFMLNKTYVCLACFVINLIAGIAFSLILLFYSVLPYVAKMDSIFLAVYFVVATFGIPVLCFSLLLCYIENTKRKVLDVSYEKWIQRDDDKYWKFT